MSEITRAQLVAKLDAIAQDATLSSQLNITLTALRDALAGSGGDATSNKDLLDKLEALRLLIDGVLTVSGTVSIASSGLPDGAATEAKQDLAKGVLDAIEANTTTLFGTLDTAKDLINDVKTNTADAATETTLDLIRSALQGVLSVADLRSLRGLAVNRPAADAVAEGTTYWAIDQDTVAVSNGVNDWREL